MSGNFVATRKVEWDPHGIVRQKDGVAKIGVIKFGGSIEGDCMKWDHLAFCLDALGLVYGIAKYWPQSEVRVLSHSRNLIGQYLDNITDGHVSGMVTPIPDAENEDEIQASVLEQFCARNNDLDVVVIASGKLDESNGCHLRIRNGEPYRLKGLRSIKYGTWPYLLFLKQFPGRIVFMQHDSRHKWKGCELDGKLPNYYACQGPMTPYEWRSAGVRVNVPAVPIISQTALFEQVGFREAIAQAQANTNRQLFGIISNARKARDVRDGVTLRLLHSMQQAGMSVGLWGGNWDKPYFSSYRELLNACVKGIVPLHQSISTIGQYKFTWIEPCLPKWSTVRIYESIMARTVPLVPDHFEVHAWNISANSMLRCRDVCEVPERIRQLEPLYDQLASELLNGLSGKLAAQTHEVMNLI